MTDNIQIEEVASHRNGISGAPFHVVTFRWAEEGDEPRPMVAILFEGEGRCAVLDREQTRQGNVTFAQGNSWRGDNFEPALRAAIERYEAAVLAFVAFEFSGDLDAAAAGWRALGRRIFQPL